MIGVRRPSVRPSVCLSDVAYIGSNSKTKRARKTKLEIGVRGHSMSLKLVPFESFGAVSYSPFIVTMAILYRLQDVKTYW